MWAFAFTMHMRFALAKLTSMKTNHNPLLTALDDVAFAEIRPEHVESAIDAALQGAEAALETIRNSGELDSYEATLGKLDQSTEQLEAVMGLVDHLESVATSDALRVVHQKAEAKVSAFTASIPLDSALWQKIYGFSQSAAVQQLSPTRQRFVSETVRAFVNAGANLSNDQKEELHQTQLELTQSCTLFAQNVLDSTNAFELLIEDRKRLSGIPETTLEMARESAARAGKQGYCFTLQAPSYIPVMTYADDRAFRHTLYKANFGRSVQAPWDNRPLLLKILELRKKRAKILGLAHFADWALQNRMAKSGATALQFVLDLALRTRPYFEKENQALQAFCEQLEGPGSPALAPWDLQYYAEKERKARYDVDDEAIRPYFVAEHVLNGIFEIASRLYGIRIEHDANASVWHDDVKSYRIIDADGRHRGSFYSDLYPRASKRDGAWMNGLRVSSPSSIAKTHLAVLCANLAPPSANRPSLLNLREVTTLFHEFGHLLHHCLSRVEVRSLGGTNVAWDFVELPSQIMENWVWEEEAQQIFAQHYQTRAPMPRELFDKVLKSRNYRAANAMMRQLGFAHLDLALHMEFDPQVHGDVIAYARDILSQYTSIPVPTDYAMVASFTHLFGHPVGYGSGYYSYKWAEVLDADAFTRFKEEGVFSEKAASDFRTYILEAGNSVAPDELYRKFRGRDPRLSALLERSDLVGV